MKIVRVFPARTHLKGCTPVAGGWGTPSLGCDPSASASSSSKSRRSSDMIRSPEAVLEILKVGLADMARKSHEIQS